MVVIDGFFGTTEDVTGIETILDLYKQELFGFQYTVSPKKIGEFCELIRAGAKFPKVNVTISDNQTHHIAFIIDSKTG
jgi:hypothetical protein